MTPGSRVPPRLISVSSIFFADYNRAIAHGDTALAQKIAVEATAGVSRSTNVDGHH